MSVKDDGWWLRNESERTQISELSVQYSMLPRFDPPSARLGSEGSYGCPGLRV